MWGEWVRVGKQETPSCWVALGSHLPLGGSASPAAMALNNNKDNNSRCLWSACCMPDAALRTCPFSLTFSSQQPEEVATAVMPIFQMRRLRHREVE